MYMYIFVFRFYTSQSRNWNKLEKQGNTHTRKLTIIIRNQRKISFFTAEMIYVSVRINMLALSDTHAHTSIGTILLCWGTAKITVGGKYCPRSTKKIRRKNWNEREERKRWLRTCNYHLRKLFTSSKKFDRKCVSVDLPSIAMPFDEF